MIERATAWLRARLERLAAVSLRDRLLLVGGGLAALLLIVLALT